MYHVPLKDFFRYERNTKLWLLQLEVYLKGWIPKGQLISKADQRAVDSPKKRKDEFDLFAVKSKKANKTNSSVCFLGESMARQSAFEINWPLIKEE